MELIALVWFVGWMFSIGAFIKARENMDTRDPWWVGLVLFVYWPGALGALWYERGRGD